MLMDANKHWRNLPNALHADMHALHADNHAINTLVGTTAITGQEGTEVLEDVHHMRGIRAPHAY